MPRKLSSNEADVLLRVLGTLPEGEILQQQVGYATVTDDSVPTFLTLFVGPEHPQARVKDGPVPGRFPVVHSDEITGEILVWVRSGRLTGLEYAWVTDDSPDAIPLAEDVRTSPG